MTTLLLAVALVLVTCTVPLWPLIALAFEPDPVESAAAAMRAASEMRGSS